jgi:ankyrin repeat protein
VCNITTTAFHQLKVALGSAPLCAQGGATPLLRAVLGGHKEVAALLLERGANVEATNMVSGCLTG